MKRKNKYSIRKLNKFGVVGEVVTTRKTLEDIREVYRNFPSTRYEIVDESKKIIVSLI